MKVPEFTEEARQAMHTLDRGIKAMLDAGMHEEGLRLYVNSTINYYLHPPTEEDIAKGKMILEAIFGRK